MVAVASASNLGQRGGAGLEGLSSDTHGIVELRYWWQEWEQPAQQSGMITLAFGVPGTALTAVVPIDAWATLAIVGLNQIQWTAPNLIGPGTRTRIEYWAV